MKFYELLFMYILVIVLAILIKTNRVLLRKMDQNQQGKCISIKNLEMNGIVLG